MGCEVCKDTENSIYPNQRFLTRGWGASIILPKQRLPLERRIANNRLCMRCNILCESLNTFVVYIRLSTVHYLEVDGI